MKFGLLLFSILLVGGISIGTSYALTEIANDDVYIPATDKFFLDGGGDTYIHEPSPNVFEIVEGGKKCDNCGSRNYVSKIKKPSTKQILNDLYTVLANRFNVC